VNSDEGYRYGYCGKFLVAEFLHICLVSAGMRALVLYHPQGEKEPLRGADLAINDNLVGNRLILNSPRHPLSGSSEHGVGIRSLAKRTDHGASFTCG